MSSNVLTNNIIGPQASNVLQYLFPSPCPNQKKKKTTKVDDQCKTLEENVLNVFSGLLVIFLWFV